MTVLIQPMEALKMDQLKGFKFEPKQLRMYGIVGSVVGIYLTVALNAADRDKRILLRWMHCSPICSAMGC